MIYLPVTPKSRVDFFWKTVDAASRRSHLSVSTVFWTRTPPAVRDVYTILLRLKERSADPPVLAGRLIQQGCIIHNLSQSVCTLPPGTLLFTVYFSGDIISSNSVSRESTCLIAAVSSWRSLTRSLPLQSVSAVKKLPSPPLPSLLASLAHLSAWNFPSLLRFMHRESSERHSLVATTAALPRLRAELRMAFILPLSLA